MAGGKLPPGPFRPLRLVAAQQPQRYHHHITSSNSFCIPSASICMWTKGAICIWRDGVHVYHHPASTVLPTPQNAPQLHKRKRELSEMSNNVRTPRKTARTVKGDADLVHSAFEDGNITPRPLHPLSNLVHLQSPNTAISTAPIETAEPDDDTHLSSGPSSRSSTYTTDSRGAKRKRSTSPAKQIEERQYAKYPIQHRPVTNLNTVNIQIQDAIKRVRRIGRAKGILSQHDTEWAGILSSGDEDLAKDILDTGEDSYGAPPDLTRMQRIVERAARNAAAGASEAAWNSGVHDFLLEEAYFGSSVGRHLIWENV